MAWDHANVESLNHLRLRLGVASQGYFEAQGSLGQGWGVWQRIFKAPLQNVSLVRAESPGRLGAASGFQHAENAETEGLKKKTSSQIILVDSSFFLSCPLILFFFFYEWVLFIFFVETTLFALATMPAALDHASTTHAGDS